MTKKQFKAAMLRGQGRCVWAVQTEPEKYRDLVLWACGQKISFDTQCEGTRAWYAFQMAKCYEDFTLFVSAAIAGLKKSRSNGGWEIAYFSELLQSFAQAGDSSAKEALWDKYQQLYDSLMARKRPKYGLFHERDDFEGLCITLATDKQSFLRMANDIGNLYRQRPFYSEWGFEQLYELKGKYYASSLTKLAKQSENLAAYLQAQHDWEKECEEQRSKHRDVQKKGISLSLCLAKTADRETVLHYAELYRSQTDKRERAEALKAFGSCVYPEDPAPILADTLSDCKELEGAAWQALAQIRHPVVREFALENLERNKEAAIAVMIKNYQPDDTKMLEEIVKSIPVDRAEIFGWHWIHMDVLNMEEDGQKAPASVLKHIYETTYCSNCRKEALGQLGKRRLLTDEILQECLLDSSEEIRSYANRCLSRRKGNIHGCVSGDDET